MSEKPEDSLTSEDSAGADTPTTDFSAPRGASSARLRFHLPLDAARLLRARHRIRDYLHGYGVDPQAVDDIVLALQEAMTNAVRHSGASEDLEVGVWVSDCDVVAEVVDHGRGFDIVSFDPHACPDPTDPGGRGLYLIVQLMDEVEMKRDSGLALRALKRGVVDPAGGQPATLQLHVPFGGTHRVERERELLEEIDEGFFALDWEYRYLRVNSAWERLYGCERESVLGLTIREAFPDVPPNAAVVALREAMELGRPSILEYLSPTLDRWVELRAYPSASGVVAYARDIDERRRRELERDELLEALRESEQRSRRFYEAGLVGVTYWNTAGEILDANNRFLEMIGYSRTELERGEIDWVNMTPPEYRSLDEKSLEELQSTGVNAVPYEKEYLRKDGTRLPIIIAGAMLDDERHLGAAFVLDVTDRKRADDALREAEARTRDLIRHAASAVYEIDFGGRRFKNVNEAMTMLSGYSRDELMAMDPFDLLDPQSQQRFAERIRGATAGRPIPENVEYGVKTKDGRLLDVTLDVAFTRSNGVIDGAFCIGHDITERKRAERALRESEERFRALFDSMTEGVALHEVIYRDGEPIDYRILRVNPAYEQQAGVSKEKAVGALASELYGTHSPPYLDTFAGVAQTGQPTSFQTFFPPLGRHFRIAVVSPTRGEFATIFEDVTERKLAEEALRRRAEELERLMEVVPVALWIADDVRCLQIRGNRTGNLFYEALPGENVSATADPEVRKFFQAGRELSADELPMQVAAATGSEVRDSEIMVELPSGRQLSILGNAAPLFDEQGEARGCVGAFIDITERKRAEAERQDLLEESQSMAEELQAQNEELRKQREELLERHDLAEALNAINSLVHSTLEREKLLQRALDEGARALAVDAGAIEIREGDCWVVRYQTGFSPRELGRRLSEREAPIATLACGLGAPVDVADLKDKSSLYVGFVRGHGLRSVLAAPLVVQEQTIGCLLFYGYREREFLQAERDFARKLASTVALALENMRLLEQERAVTRVQEALSRVDESVHSTLDRDELLQRVAEESATAIGAWSTVLALREGERWVIRYVYNLPTTVLGAEFSIEQAPFMGIAAATKRPVAIDDAFNDSRAELQTQQALGVRAVMLTPLIVGGDVIGGLFFNYPEVHAFTEQELLYASRLSSSIGLALANVELYRAQRRIAVVLQQNLVHPLRAIAGLEMASLSAPAARDELVGGDLADVFQLPDGLVVALIVDVMGKGIKAAGTAEAIRSAVRSAALLSPSPAFILGHVNSLLLLEGDQEQMATALLAVLDLTNGKTLVASAGHPPLACLSPDGCRVIDTPHGLTLGAFGYVYEEAQIQLQEGETMVFYTDGLTEARSDDGLFGESRLLTVLQHLSKDDPQQIVGQLMETLLSFAGELKDDLQILALRRKPIS